MKKYKLLDTDTKTFLGRTLFRIQALTSFGNVEEGDLGGYIEREENLAHGGDAWIYDDAYVCGNARVYDNARVFGNACIFHNACVFHNAWIYDNARVCGYTWVCDNARVCCDALVFNETDILCVRGIGSEHHYTTVYMTKDGKPFVACGCFLGTLSEFEAKVKKTCDDSKYAREYQLFIELVKLHFNMKEER